MAHPWVFCILLGATPALSARVVTQHTQQSSRFNATTAAQKVPSWKLDIKGLNCFVPSFAPIHGVRVHELVKDPQKVQDHPLKKAALDAVKHMTALAAKKNCHVCDASFWGSDPAEKSKSAAWASFSASCASSRIGKGAGSSGGACFSATDPETGQVVPTHPMPDLSEEDCRQCPAECSKCEPETAGFFKNELTKFKCMLKEKPMTENMARPVKGYVCQRASKRRSKGSAYKTRCKFPEFVRCKASDADCAKKKDYREFWPEDEKMSRTSESVKLDLGVVDCISPAPLKLKLAGHMKDWEMAHKRAAEEMWKISAQRNVDHCKLAFVFEKGIFKDVEVDDAIKDLGVDACSGRNGLLQNLGWTKLKNACKEGSMSCCTPCPHACKACTASKDGTSFTCKLKTVSPAFSGKLGMFVNPEHPISDPSLPPLRGFKCSTPTNFETKCSMVPTGHYPVLPEPPAESTYPMDATVTMNALDNQKSRLVMGIYDGTQMADFQPPPPPPPPSQLPPPPPPPPADNSRTPTPTQVTGEPSGPPSRPKISGALAAGLAGGMKNLKKGTGQPSGPPSKPAGRRAIPMGLAAGLANGMKNLKKAKKPAEPPKPKAPRGNPLLQELVLKAKNKDKSLAHVEAPPPKEKSGASSIPKGVLSSTFANIDKIAEKLLDGLDDGPSESETCDAAKCEKMTTPDDWDEKECDWCPNAACCEECCE